MSGRINQKTFNEAVLENMELFSMSLEESIKETIEQFKVQGVELYGIITDSRAVSSSENPVEVIKEGIKTGEESTKIDLITELHNLIQADHAYKVSCDKLGIFEQMIDILLDSNCSSKLQIVVLDFLIELIHGYPDVVTDKGLTYFLSLLENDIDNKKIGLKLISLSCIKHENNKQKCMDLNIDLRIHDLLINDPSDELLMSLCTVVISIIRDDDIRASVPKSYSHACKFADILLKPLCRILQVSATQYSLLNILKALSAMTVNHMLCEQVETEEGLSATINVLQKYRAEEPIVTQCFNFLTCLAGSDSVKKTMMEYDLPNEVKFSLNRHLAVKRNVNAALRLVSKICLRSPQFGEMFFKVELPPLIVQGIQVHFNDDKIQASGLWCVRNMCSRNVNYHEQFLSLGIEEILNKIIESNAILASDVKIALQELRCSVSADEPWTGEKGDKLASS